MKSFTMYQCEYCNHQLKTENGIKNHEKTCSKNPTVIQAEKAKSGIDKEIEDIRLKATSIPDLISRLDRFWLSKGIKVHFNSYPNQWNDLVSNSHNSPTGYKQNWCGYGDKEGIPKGYPGWQGRWKGHIEVVDSSILNLNKTPDFWDITGNGISSSLMNIPWLKTGSGGGGNTFNYEGIFFLYDFPKMYEEWKNNGEELKLLVNEYNQNILKLKQEFEQHRKVWVHNQEEIASLHTLQSTLQGLLRQTETAIKDSIIYYNEEYKKEYSLQLPDIPSAFIDNQLHKNITALTILEEIDKPEIKNLFDLTKEKAEKVTSYKLKNPELFI